MNQELGTLYNLFNINHENRLTAYIADRNIFGLNGSGIKMNGLGEISSEGRLEIVQRTSSTRCRDLITALTTDHKEIMHQLWVLSMIISREDWPDYKTAVDLADELETSIKKHASDEESRLLLISTEISENVEERASEAIAVVFQQHKLILAAFKNLPKLSESLSNNYWKAFHKLVELISTHIREEEDKIFPFLMSKI